MKPVEYKEKYLVYPDGRIWIKRWNRFAKLTKTSYGYLIVSINARNERVHRIIATCFIPNPLNKSEVNHIDGNKTNNHIDNLEWNTPAENLEHSINVLGNTHGRKKTPIRATHILTGETYEFPSQRECARVLGFENAYVNGYIKGKRKPSKGYTFQCLPQINS